MHVAQFKTADEVNEFTKTVVLHEQNPIQHNGEDFIVFYEAKKDDYENYFLNRMIEGLTRNLFHEEVRHASLEAEVKEFTDNGGKSDAFDDVMKREKEARQNIKLFKAKIASLEAWTNKN